MDVPLDDSGRADAEKLASYFHGSRLGGIIHSDRRRSAETAQIIAKPHGSGVPVGREPNLQAWNLGDFAGKEKTAANLKALDEYVANPGKKVPGGERLADFAARVRPVLDYAIEHGKTGDPLLLVAHSSTIHELGKMLHGDQTSALVKPGGVAVVGQIGDHVVAVPLIRADHKGDKSPGS